MKTRLFCFAPFGGRYAVHHQLDLALALGVRIKGGDAVILGCRGSYDTCEAIMCEAPANLPAACSVCARQGEALLTIGANPFVTLDQLVAGAEIEDAAAWSRLQAPPDYAQAIYNGRPLGKWALSSLLTAFQISTKQLHRPDIVPFYQALLRNAVLTTKAVERVVQQFQPTVASVFNARFSQYRTAFEVLRAAGVRVLVHERGFADNTFLFYDNRMINDTKALLDIVTPWQEVPLTTSELERVHGYIRGRESGRDFNAPAFVQYTSDEQAVRHRLNVGESSLLGFFTSTETELAQAEDMSLANTQIPLLRRVVEACRRNPEVTLVIRHHPNLAGDKNHDPDYAFLSDCYRVLVDAPANIRCIMPSEKLSTYALMWHLDAAIAPVSSVGVELPSRGVPSLTTAGTCYALAQAETYTDPQAVDVEQTLARLRQRGRNFNVDDLRPGYRFLYSYIERGSYQFQSLGIKNFYQAAISPDIVADLAGDKDPHFSRILSGLIHQRSIYPEPGEVDRARSKAEETSFLQREVDVIKEKRARLFFEATRPALPQQSVALLELSPRSSRFPSIFQSRYESLAVSRVQVGSSVSATLQSLLQEMINSSVRYVAVVHPDVSYDGHFVGEGVEGLESAAGGLKAVVRGVWLADTSGNLFSELLSERVGIPSAESLQQGYGACLSPLHLLSLGFYEASYARVLLEKLIACKDESEMIRLIVKEWSQEGIDVRLAQAGLMCLEVKHL